MTTAAQFIEALRQRQSPQEAPKVAKFFRGDDGRTQALGVRFGDVFALAEEHRGMELAEVEALLESDYYEARMGAVSIMDFQARHKKTTQERRQALFDLYLRRHDRLNNWDFVDRGAAHIIGEFLVARPRDVLYRLARSQDPWERRTAIVATHAFLKRGQWEDTFAIAGLLALDPHEYVQKAVGSWVREAGKKSPEHLFAFLEQYGPRMDRGALRTAIERLSPAQREHYMRLQ